MKLNTRYYALSLSERSSGCGFATDRSHGMEGGEVEMLWTIGIILLVLWLLGLVTAHTFGGVIHVLLVIALVVIVIRLIQGRRV